MFNTLTEAEAITRYGADTLNTEEGVVETPDGKYWRRDCYPERGTIYIEQQ